VSSAILDDLLCLAYFDLTAGGVWDALKAGTGFEIPKDPVFLGAACAPYGIQVRRDLPLFGVRG